MHCNYVAISLCSALKMNQWLGSGAAQPMVGKPTRMGGASGYIMQGILQGSSDFFSISDDKIFALQDLKPCPLNEQSQRIQTSLYSADSLLLISPLRLQQLVYGLPLSDESLFRELLYKRKFILRFSKCRAVFCHCGWQTRQVCFMLGRHPRGNSIHRDGMSPLLWRESLLSVLAASFLFIEQPRP